MSKRLARAQDAIDSAIEALEAMGDKTAEHVHYLRGMPLLPEITKDDRRNEHLSVSRIGLYEQCGAAYAFRYIPPPKSEKPKVKEPEERAEAPELGNLLHSTLEELYRWIVDEGYTGSIPEDKLLEIYQSKWPKYSLLGVSMYQQGIGLLRDYVRKQPPVDHFSILAIEKPFELQLEEFKVVGYIDRVDKISEDRIRIIDYKSNRILFTRDDVDTSLQMSVYGLAAKVLWPWAKHVDFEFHMLRHGIAMATSRTQEQLIDSASYVVAVGREMETATKFPERLNLNCSYCDYRSRCSMYQSAITGQIKKQVFVKDDLESVAAAYDQAAKLAKMFYARKKECEEIIQAHLVHHDSIEAGGYLFTMKTVDQSTEYPVGKTLALLAKYTKRSVEELEAHFRPSLGKGVVEDFLALVKKEQSSAIAALLEVELAGLAKVVKAPRFDPKHIKKDSRRQLPVAGATIPALPEEPPR